MHAIATETAEDRLAQNFRIAALRGGVTSEIQPLLAAFSVRRIKEGWRVAGVVEAELSTNGVCGSLVLRSVESGGLFPIYQDLGPGSAACKLDTGGLAAACQSVIQSIEHGADLVVLSKFGKIEAAGGGLMDAFRAAAEAGIPCVTGVSPLLTGPFQNFAGEYSEWVEVSSLALESWWASA